MTRVVRFMRIVVFTIFASASIGSHAVDAVSLAYATGNSTKMLRIGTQWRWDRQWQVSGGANVSGYWDLTLAEWRGTRYRNVDQAQNITDIGITPVFRLQKDDCVGWYGEAGIGAHLFSAIYDNAGSRLSTAFEFGDHVGFGYVTTAGMDIGLLFQHFSNGRIKQPNDGVNFAMIRMGYSF